MSDRTQNAPPAHGMTGRFAPAIADATGRLAGVDPIARALAIGAAFADGEFRFAFLGMDARVGFPTGACFLDGSPAGGTDTVLLLHYVLEGKDLAPLGWPRGRWISFREVPDAAAYFAAYQSRGPALIARHFADRPEAFERAALALGARRAPDLPGVAFVLAALPRIALALIFHEGEPGLPAEAQILFDAAAPAIWRAEDLAVLGESAAARLVGKG